MSIIRVGLAETKNYSDGWDAIFSGGKSRTAKSAVKAKSTAKKKTKSAKKKK